MAENQSKSGTPEHLRFKPYDVQLKEAVEALKVAGNSIADIEGIIHAGSDDIRELFAIQLNCAAKNLQSVQDKTLAEVLEMVRIAFDSKSKSSIPETSMGEIKKFGELETVFPDSESRRTNTDDLDIDTLTIE